MRLSGLKDVSKLYPTLQQNKAKVRTCGWQVKPKSGFYQVNLIFLPTL